MVKCFVPRLPQTHQITPRNILNIKPFPQLLQFHLQFFPLNILPPLPNRKSKGRIQSFCNFLESIQCIFPSLNLLCNVYRLSLTYLGVRHRDLILLQRLRRQLILSIYHIFCLIRYDFLLDLGFGLINCLNLIDINTHILIILNCIACLLICHLINVIFWHAIVIFILFINYLFVTFILSQILIQFIIKQLPLIFFGNSLQTFICVIQN